MASLPTTATNPRVAAGTRHSVALARVAHWSIWGIAARPRRPLPIELTMTVPVYGALALGTARWCGQVPTGAGVLLAAASAAVVFHYLRSALRLGVGSALTGGLLWMIHPVCRPFWTGEPAWSSGLMMFVIPGLILGVYQFGRTGKIEGLLIVGALAGLLVGQDTVFAGLLMFMTVIYGCVEAWSSRVTAEFEHVFRRCAVVLLIVFTVAVASHSVAKTAGWASASEMSDGKLNLPSTAWPGLSWVDAGGLVESRLSPPSTSGAASTGPTYLGCSLILLAFVGVGSARRCDGVVIRRMAILVVMGFVGLWPTGSKDSLHRLVVLLFEQITVRRHIDPWTLNLFGLAMFFIAMLPVMFGMTIVRLLRGNQASSLIAILVAAGVTWMWWYAGPVDVNTLFVVTPSRMATQCAGVGAAFALVVAGSIGFERLLDTRFTRRRFIMGLIVVSVASIDLLGLSWPETATTPIQENSVTASAHSSLESQRKGERAQVVFTEVNRLPNQLAARLPPLFYRQLMRRRLNPGSSNRQEKIPNSFDSAKTRCIF